MSDNAEAALVAEIREHIAGIEQSSMRHKIAVGQKFIEAKSRLPKGAWMEWLKANDFQQTTAVAWMRLARAIAFAKEKP